jgi:hypothetical protein
MLPVFVISCHMKESFACASPHFLHRSQAIERQSQRWEKKEEKRLKRARDQLSRKENGKKTKTEEHKLHDDFAIFERERENEDAAFQQGQMMSLLVVAKG